MKNICGFKKQRKMGVTTAQITHRKILALVILTRINTKRGDPIAKFPKMGSRDLGYFQEITQNRG